MCTLDQSTLTIISAVGGVIGAVGGLFAAVAAFRSAGTAKEAAKHAQQVEHRELVRDVIAAAQNTIAETMRVDDISNKLKMGYRELSIFTGQLGGSRGKAHTGEVEKKQQQVIPLQQEAIKLLEDKKSLREKEESELTDELVKYEGYVIQVRRVKEKLELDLASVERENQTFRENAIKST